MDPAVIKQVVTALSIIAQLVDALGVGGIVSLALAGPVLIVLAVLVLSHLNNTRVARLMESYRTDADRRFEEHRRQTDMVLERYGEALRETAQYYNDNVELVRSFSKMANGFQDLVVSNTRTLERLCNDVEHHVFCPLARDKKGL